MRARELEARVQVEFVRIPRPRSAKSSLPHNNGNDNLAVDHWSVIAIGSHRGAVRPMASATSVARILGSKMHKYILSAHECRRARLCVA